MAIVTPLVITGMVQVSWSHLNAGVVGPFLIGVMLCAWYGGLGPGLLSLCISLLAVNYFFMQPYLSFGPPDKTDLTRLLIFAVLGSFISVLSELLHRSRRVAETNLETIKCAEKALREKERFANQIAELSPFVINVFDLTTRRSIYVSSDAVSLFGYTAQEILEMEDPFSVLWHPEDIPRATGNIARLQQSKNGEIPEIEYRIRRRDGEWRWVASRGMPFEHNGEGEVRQIISATFDITERKRADEALREAENRYRDIFENAGEGIFQSTPDGRYLAANPAFARMHGFASPEELIRTCKDISKQIYVDPERREDFKRSIERDGVVRGFQHQVLRKDGSIIWITVNARAVRDDHGKIAYYEGTAQDVTERKLAEQRLRESEERYRELFENAKDALYVHDLQGRYISVNRAAEKLSGLSREQILGKSFMDFVPPEQVQTVREHLCRKLVTEGQTIYESEVITKDGRRIPVEINSHLIYENGLGVLVQGTARDITERKRAEERLREYEKVVEGVEEMIVVVDRDYRYLLANRAFLNHLALKREDVIGHLVSELLGAEIFGKIIKRNLDACFKGNVVKYETRLTNPIGERDMSVAYFPIEGALGIDRVACVLQDITERKLAEEELRQSEERFSKAFHSSPAALCVALLEDGKLMEVNNAFLRMTGYGRADLINKSTSEVGLWPDPKQKTTMAGLVREQGAVTDLELNFRKKSGDIRDGLFSIDLIELSGKACVLGMALDITERKRGEAAARNYSRLLIEAQEAERQSIARELHDQIGQVLTAIRINLQTVRQSCETSESRASIDEGTEMVDQALGQVRDLSFELRPSLLDDLGLVAALRWYCDRYAKRTGIRTATVTNLASDEFRLRKELETACFRIVQEALTNVARHAEASSVLINLETLHTGISLSIKDDGIGFGEHSRNTAASPHLLGLRGMQERALALGGEFEVNSAAPRGTEIRAHFPNGQ